MFLTSIPIGIDFFICFWMNPMQILTAKYTISTPLMMENPVSSPMVPPTVDNFVSKFAFSSFVIRSKVGVAK